MGMKFNLRRAAANRNLGSSIKRWPPWLHCTPQHKYADSAVDKHTMSCLLLDKVIDPFPSINV